MQHEMDRVAKWVTHRLISWRLGLLALAALAAAAALPISRQVEFDRSVENMLSDHDPILAPYRQLKRTFGGNEIALAVYQDQALLAPDGSGIRRLATIRQRLQQIPGVRAVLSLDRLMGELIIDPDNELAKRTRKLFEGYTHGEDGKTAVAVCMLSAESDERIPREKASWAGFCCGRWACRSRSC
jgi:predicted RND superfamily exporter protein